MESDGTIGDMRNEKRVLNARCATYLLVIFLGAHVLCGAVTGLLATVIGSSPGKQSLENTVEVMEKMLPITVVLTPFIAGGIAIVASFILIPNDARSPAATGGAWLFGSWHAIGKGLIIGVIVAMSYNIVKNILNFHIFLNDLSLVDKMALSAGLPQVAWLAGVIVIAPITEELLFRGVFYGGYRESFGPAWAAILTTCLFLMPHGPQLFRFPPALIGLVGLSVACLWARLRYRAIGPAIAVHLSYNTTFALMVLFK